MFQRRSVVANERLFLVDTSRAAASSQKAQRMQIVLTNLQRYVRNGLDFRRNVRPHNQMTGLYGLRGKC